MTHDPKDVALGALIPFLELAGFPTTRKEDHRLEVQLPSGRKADLQIVLRSNTRFVTNPKHRSYLAAEIARWGDHRTVAYSTEVNGWRQKVVNRLRLFVPDQPA